MATEKTLGVVLSTIPYNDRTQFVHIYTQTIGKITCRVKATPRSRRTSGRNYFSPLTLLDMVIDKHGEGDLYDIAEATLVSSPYLMPSLSDPGKTAQSIYMAELLDKTIREVEANDRLWHFVEQSIEALPIVEEGAANFHLLFTTRLCYLLGFTVDISQYREGMQFDIREGIFTDRPIGHPNYLTPLSAAWLYKLLNTPFGSIGSLQLSREQRNSLLDMMLTFLRIHLPDAGELKSVEVLKELFA